MVRIVTTALMWLAAISNTRGHHSVVRHARPHYVIRNDSYGHRRECLRSRRGRSRSPVVTVRHVRYHLAHWVTSHEGTRWNYIQFNRVEPVARVRDLSVRRFIWVAERHGLISPRWWLTSVEAGFEIWRGGRGLKTYSFSVHTQRA